MKGLVMESSDALPACPRSVSETINHATHSQLVTSTTTIPLNKSANFILPVKYLLDTDSYALVLVVPPMQSYWKQGMQMS